jgi:hypothetical protein
MPSLLGKQGSMAPRLAPSVGGTTKLKVVRPVPRSEHQTRIELRRHEANAGKSTYAQLYEIRRFRLQGPTLRAWSGIQRFFALQIREHPIEVEIELGGIGPSPFVDLLNDFILRLPGQIP